jgi:ankyrin repeat protein
MSDQELIKLVYKGEIVSIYKLLKQTEAQPFLVKDQKHYTLLHIASLNGSYALFAFLLTYTKRNFKSWLSVIQDWVNQSTEDGFTALHFAAFRGNLVIST